MTYAVLAYGERSNHRKARLAESMTLLLDIISGLADQVTPPWMIEIYRGNTLAVRLVRSKERPYIVLDARRVPAPDKVWPRSEYARMA